MTAATITPSPRNRPVIGGLRRKSCMQAEDISASSRPETEDGKLGVQKRGVQGMAYIQLPEGLPGIRGLLAFRPETAGPLGALTDALLHSPGTLSLGERELIAAYVSRLNDCSFCYTSHAAIATWHLKDESLV